MTDAQLFAEIRACGSQMPSPRGLAVLKEAQKRLKGRSLSRSDLIARMGLPTNGEHSDSIASWTKGAFTEQTADSVLVWETYEGQVIYQFWYAVKDGRVVGSGNYFVGIE
jgi:hypothetical protein